ncbi:anti-phage deoxyguanosine triphosphatase [Methylobacillus glycogenes]|uniref:anti-phage deoxyguanosine triphosphatase n=1 Tax=Methylobacillus glycogenes TaxID=406 RepID=UPI001901D3EE|nr:anti-phage deoxyguanosine triphosphatase [Methylobacillus glycogenes]
MEHKHSPLSPAWIARRRYEAGYTGKTFNSDSLDSEYQRDRARIIHSASFRRLQSKTQIFSIGDSDFYRTRLTHSLEVAQIGSGICERLRQTYAQQSEIQAWIPSMGLIEAICLGHDLGHPPFGHGGEVALNSVMHAHGGFEGNGQTLRIISRLGEYSPEHGLDLSRRTMLGLLKYPVLHHEVANYPQAPAQQSSNIDHAQPPKCLHDDEADVLEWILAAFSPQDSLHFRQQQARVGKHGKALHQGFDTSIMELADDIAYGVHDLEDALAMELVSARQWQELVLQPAQALSTCPLMQETDFYQQKLFSGSDRERKHAISRLVNYFIANIRVTQQAGFDSPALQLQAEMEQEAHDLLLILKKFVMDVVIRRPQIQALEFKGQQMIMRLFTTLLENAERLLPSANLAQLQQSGNAERVICDYIASMTDIHATRLYHRLFSPDIGSVFDK